jgi:hypothetical protein
MTYKEKVLDEIKKDKLKKLWEEICDAYEKGGSDGIESLLNSKIEKVKKEYNQLLNDLEKIL